jgi:hypothetical protein
MLQRGDLLPHFEVNTFDGAAVAYSTIRQQRNIVLVALPGSVADESLRTYISRLLGLRQELRRSNTECVITTDKVAGIPAPGVAVADEWGEIVYVASGSTVAELPSPADLLEWVRYVESRCPECEGEAK